MPVTAHNIALIAREFKIENQLRTEQVAARQLDPAPSRKVFSESQAYPTSQPASRMESGALERSAKNETRTPHALGIHDGCGCGHS